MNWVDVPYHNQTGQWIVGEEQIEVYNIQHTEVYRSPQEPSFVCWVVLWREADGTLKCAFTEASGDPARWPPTYNFNEPGIEYYTKTFISKDQGQTWTDTGWKEPQDPLWVINPDHHWRRTVVMPDGTLLRLMPHTVEGIVEDGKLTVYHEELEGQQHNSWSKMFPFTEEAAVVHPKRMAIWRSADGGESWEEVFCDAASPFWGSCLLLCEDGRLVTVGAMSRMSGGVGIRESYDEGRSWSQPCLVVPAEGEFADIQLGEENEVVELSDGRLLLVCRTDNAEHFVQAYLTRTAPGQYEASDIRFAPMPHSGYPFLLKCSDGSIWYAGHGSHFVTLDGGVTWQEHHICSSYYPQMIEIEPGCILNVTQQSIGDNAFPHTQDAAIGQTRFCYRRADILEQRDASIPLALTVLEGPPSSENRLRVWVRAEGRSGVAFRVQPGPSPDYYTYMLELDTPENEEAKAGTMMDAFHLIGKVTGGQMQVLRRRYLGEIAVGEWVQMQVRTDGDLLQGATHHNAPYYLSIRDSSLSQGGIGLVTAASLGAFKVLEVLAPTQLIREGWWR